MDYKSIISSNQEKIKNLHQKLSTYSDQIESGSNTILIEKEIEKDISSLKDSLNELESAYNYKNAPSQMSSNEIDRRQKEIKNYK
jgi:peptidoglycan hydrolase CwlO-like protein